MKTLTITREEYRRAVGDAIIDMTTGEATNNAERILLEIVVSTKLATALEAKLFGESDDE